MHRKVPSLVISVKHEESLGEMAAVSHEVGAVAGGLCGLACLPRRLL